MAGFENPEILGLLIVAVPAVYLALTNSDRYKRAVPAVRTLVIVLLVVAAASPFINAEQKASEQAEIVVLKDKSTSSSLMENPELEFDEVKTREKIIASGNNSDLRGGILRNLEPNTAYLAVSDFQSDTSLDGISQKFQQKNSSLNAIKTDMDEEAAVSIQGPASTVPGARNRFSVEVSSTQKVPEPRVKVDGQEAELQKEAEGRWSFTRSFSSQGSHRITATIKSRDEFGQNNRYFHAVEVTEKPEILIVGERGSLGSNLDEFYDVSYSGSIPEDLSDYYTVILKKKPSEEPVSYVSEGNGLVYTGEYGEELEILPVRESPGEPDAKGAKIVMAIDISKSTGESESIKKSKQIAYNLAEKLPFNNRVGAVAYNRDAYVVQKPRSLAKNREQLKRKISRLQTSGPSFHHNGLKGAKKLLNGTGNIILVTDGRIGGLGQNRNVDSKTKRTASNLQVQLITVGVGDGTDKRFLQEVAERGDGFHLDAKDSERLKFQFEGGGAEGENSPLVVVNPNHFITEELSLSTTSSAFSNVETKRGSKLLVTSSSGKPFLTTWRYGLGRVAAFSGGDTELTQLSRVDPRLLTRTVSWTAGDPKRKKDEWLEVENSRQPQPVNVQSSKPAGNLKRQGENLYTAEIRPETTGFHEFSGKTYSYSYTPEIEEVGYDSEMREIVRATGGTVYEPDETERIEEELKRFSEKKVVSKKSLSPHLLLLALVVLLAEIGYRKMNGRR